MRFLIFSGIIALISGLALLLLPERLKGLEQKADDFINRVVSCVDRFVFKYNKGMGICLFLSGATLLFVAYYLYKT